MKRLLALLLAIVMIFSLCACANDGGFSSDGEDDRNEDDKDQDKDEEMGMGEKSDYPLTYEFTLNDIEYTLKFEDTKNIRLTTVEESSSLVCFKVCTGEFMGIKLEEDVRISVIGDDAEVQVLTHLVGKYKESKGVYTLTIDQMLYSMEFSGEDAKEAKKCMLEGTSEWGEADLIEEMINGKEVNLYEARLSSEEAEEFGFKEIVVEVEIDEDTLEAMTVYEEDGETISAFHTFYGNGMVKETTEYAAGVPSYYYEYDKKGNMIYEEDLSNNLPDDDGPLSPETTETPAEPTVKLMEDLVGSTKESAMNFLVNTQGVPENMILLIEENHANVPSGSIIRTDPVEGEELKAGEAIKLYVSLGPVVKKVTMVDLTSDFYNEDSAIKWLDINGFRFYSIQYVESDKPAGKIVSQSVPAGETVNVDTVVVLKVSQGEETQPTDPES